MLASNFMNAFKNTNNIIEFKIVDQMDLNSNWIIFAGYRFSNSLALHLLTIYPLIDMHNLLTYYAVHACGILIP